MQYRLELYWQYSDCRIKVEEMMMMIMMIVIIIMMIIALLDCIALKSSDIRKGRMCIPCRPGVGLA
jgi:hypothetical protein